VNVLEILSNNAFSKVLHFLEISILKLYNMSRRCTISIRIYVTYCRVLKVVRNVRNAL